MDYQSNSHKGKEPKDKSEKKDLEKVVEGDVSVKPKTIGSKIKSIFFGGDVNTAASYVVGEVLLPALRNLVVETVSKGADRLIYGESSMRHRRPTNYGSRVQYNNPLARETRSYLPDQRPIDRWSRSSKAFDDIVVSSKTDADNVVERLIDIVDHYAVASVADLYELLGLPSTHVDNKWGWTNLKGIEVRQVREGYKLSFPPVEEI